MDVNLKTDSRHEYRLDLMRRIMQATGENTKAAALDVVMNHYLADLDNKRRVARKLDDGMASELSTPWLPIQCETRVGRTDE